MHIRDETHSAYVNTLKNTKGKWASKNTYYRSKGSAMQPITIPRKLASGDDLVVIPRRKYEEFLRLRRQESTQKPKNLSEVYSKLDKQLDIAIKEYSAGKYYGPFSTVEELKKSLEI